MKRWVVEFLKWCDDNEVRNIPRTEEELIELRELELNGLGLTEVTEHIVNLNSLFRLDLSDNYLKDLPDLPPCLYRLNISNNLFQQFPSSLQKLQDFALLEAEDNMIEEIPKWFGDFRGLIGLMLGNNKIPSIEPLRTRKDITTLLVGENEISDISPIYEMPKLKIFDCSGNPVKKIEKGIRKCRNLRTFASTETQMDEIDLGLFLFASKLYLPPSDTLKLRIGNMIFKYPFLKRIARKLLLRGEYAENK